MTAAVERPSPNAQIAGLALAMILLDPELAVAELNPAAEHLLGQSAIRLLDRPILDILELEDSRVEARLREAGAALVARGVAVRTSERALQADLTISPLASHPGWRVATLSEIGQDEAAQIDQGPALLHGPAILAHEIRNPLAAIRGAGQLLARKLGDKDVAMATIIVDEADRIGALIGRMQRLDDKAAEPVTAFNLHEAVRNALSTVRAAGTGEAEIVEEFDPSLPQVLGSRHALEQVLINLVSNALDANAGRVGATIAVRTRFASGLIFNAVRPGRSIRLPIELRVSDSGPGIAPELRDRVFEPFVTSKAHGQGLGLALVRKLVRDMDGRIAHERDERAGLTHFRIHLPVAKQLEAP